MNAAVMFVGEWLAVFLCALLGGVCWARYTQHAADGNRWHAATWDSLIVAVGGISFGFYIENRWLITASIVGTFVGTFLGVGKKHG